MLSKPLSRQISLREFHIISLQQYARHDGANIKIYIITLSKDTYTLISRVMSLGYDGGRYVLTQLGWNF